MRQMTLDLERDISSVFAEVAITPREWKVLEARVDLSLTLEETGKQLGGLTRERIRQLESKAIAKLDRSILEVKPILDVLDRDLGENMPGKIPGRKKAADLGEREVLATRIQKILERSGWICDESDTKRLMLLIRALVFAGSDKTNRSNAEKNWPRLTYLACKLSPPILGHRNVARWELNSRNAKKNLSYKNIAIQVLQEAREPLHWKVISERGYRLGRRNSFSTAAIYNSLQSHSNVFVRVGQGTYALVEWGMNEAEYYPDIIASVLEKEKRPLPAETIFSRVNQVRPIKRQTLTMSLDMNPRFYKSIEFTYGLRSWLPPREKQTMRTPEWLIEDSSSIMRVERAIERGYKVQLQSETEIE